MINSKIQKIKNKLIAFGYLDNEYLDKYLTLLEVNFTTSRCWGKTQAHHAVPAALYRNYEGVYNRRTSIKSADADPDNIVVHLLYNDHLLAHAYLTLCSDLTKIQAEYEAEAPIRKRNSHIGVTATNKSKALKRNTESADESRTVKKSVCNSSSAARLELLKYFSEDEAEEIMNL